MKGEFMMNQSAAWLVKFIQDEAKKALQPPAYLAEVTSVLPFKVRLMGVELGQPFLFMSETLHAAIHADPPIVGMGDTVLVVPLQNQNQYVALSKVVSA
jgi:hypothetical protein